jgi:hypothetical protein
MASRMEKYHSNASNLKSRSVKNEGLYRDIYENVQYSNIEGIATIDKTNEIDLAKIQELLKEREQIRKKDSTVKRATPKVNVNTYDERNYDIRDILVKAKDNKVDDNKKRSLRNTQYNILKNIDIKDYKSYDEEEIEKTLANTNVLKNVNDEDLCLDMLSDLKSSGDTLVNNSENLKDLLKEVAEAKDKYEVKNEDDDLDKSFYTSSLNFKEEDFEQLKDIQDSIDSNNKMIKVLFILLFLVILVGIGFVIFKFF